MSTIPRSCIIAKRKRAASKGRVRYSSCPPDHELNRFTYRATDEEGFKRHVKRIHFKTKQAEGEEFEAAWRDLIINPKREATPEGELRLPPAPCIRLGPPRRMPHTQVLVFAEPSKTILAGTSSLGLYIPSTTHETTHEASRGVFSAPPPYTTSAPPAVSTPALSSPRGASLNSSFTSPGVITPPEYSSTQQDPHHAPSSSGLSTSLPPSSFVAPDPTHRVRSPLPI